MKVSNGYFRHPVSGEMIRPGEMYTEFGENDVAAPVYSKKEEEGEIGDDNENKPFGELTVPELKTLAEKSGIEGFSNMRKAELVAALEALKGAGKDETDDDADGGSGDNETTGGNPGE